MVKNKKRKPKENKEQSQRFIDKAKELGSDESGRSFVRAFKKIISANNQKTK